MTNMKIQSEYDMAVERILSRAQKMRAIQQMMVEDPLLEVELRTVLEVTPAPPLPKNVVTTVSVEEPPVDARKRIEAKVQVQKVIKFFEENGNTMVPVREIAEETGLSRATVNALLYTSSEKDRFSSLRVGPKKKLWHLREETELDQHNEMTVEELKETGIDISEID